jgi:hypothetical protein
MLEFLATLSVIALVFCTATVFVSLIAGMSFKLLNRLRKTTQSPKTC